MRSLPAATGLAIATLAALALLAAAILADGPATPPQEAPNPPTASGSAQQNTDPGTAADAVPGDHLAGIDQIGAQPVDAHHDRIEVTTEPAGLFGKLLDHRSQTLPGISIRLLRQGAPEHQALWATTDDAGKFAFADVHGTFDCSVWNHVRVSRAVTIPRDARENVLLQITEPCILVSGTVQAGQRPINDRTVGVHGRDARGEVHHDAHTDQHGCYRHLLRPGRYEIAVVGPPTSIAWNFKGTTVWAETSTAPTDRQLLELAEAPTRVERNFRLPSARVEVRVQTSDGLPVGDASVTIRSTTNREHTWTRRTDTDGTIHFDELPPDTWTLCAQHDMHLEAMQRELTTRAHDGVQKITLTMTAAGAAIVKLTHNGELLEPLDSAQIQLSTPGHGTQDGRRAEGGLWLYRGVRFDAVPTGTSEVRCQNVRRADGTIRYAPIDPIAPRAIKIEAGQTTEIELPVRHRPRLLISVAGGSQPDTTITVSNHEGRIAPSRRGDCYWHAEVPAGDYTVAVRRGERQHVEQVSVFRDEVQHVVNLGW